MNFADYQKKVYPHLVKLLSQEVSRTTTGTKMKLTLPERQEIAHLLVYISGDGQTMLKRLFREGYNAIAAADTMLGRRRRGEWMD
jgi:hypothetical protein